MKTSSLHLVGIVALASFTASATTHYVELNCTNPVAPFTSWATAATNIQQALNTAAGGETVMVTNGVYRYGMASSSRGSVPNNVTVQSVNGPSVTIIAGCQVPGTTNGPGAIRCVNLNSGATLSRFTLTNGATTSGDSTGGGGFGGGAAASALTRCVLSNNFAAIGGGVCFGTVSPV